MDFIKKMKKREFIEMSLKTVAAVLSAFIAVILMEGMILGKPFISTDVAGTKEMSNNNKCGFISNDNNELCDYALKLLEDKKLYDKMSKDSQIHAANFTLTSQIKNIESLIDGN